MKALPSFSLTGFLFFIHIITQAQNCTLTCPPNMVVKADSGKEGATISFPAAKTTGNCGTISYSPASGSFFRLGSHSVTVSTSSGQKCAFTITVTDNEPPVLSKVTLSPKRLWPVTNKMKRVAVNYTASDNAVEVKTTVTVSSNDFQANNQDWQVLDNHQVRLKAARLPGGAPRIFMITVMATDTAGNITKRTTSIAVSKTMTPVEPAKN